VSPEGPPDREGREAASHWRGLDDEGLLTALGGMLSPHETPPGWLLDLAKGSYALRAIDTELAALTSDSELDTTVSLLRAGSAPRLIVFEAGDLTVEIEVRPGNRAGQWQLIGQLIPAGPARIQLRRAAGAEPAEPAWVDADERGRFAVDDLAGGPLSLTCVREGRRAVTTAWITID
jgi:hypothetical protein